MDLEEYNNDNSLSKTNSILADIINNNISNDSSDFTTINLENVSLDLDPKIEENIIQKDPSETSEIIIKIKRSCFMYIIAFIVISPAIIAVLVYVLLYCIK